MTLDARPPTTPTDASGTSATDRALLRVGAVTGITGIVVELVTGHLHPSHADPNHSRAAFTEYSSSSIWTDVHIGQLVGTLLIVATLLVLGRMLSRQPGAPGALALVGSVTAVVLAAVFTVQMAVDGVALRTAVHTWATATGTDKISAYQVALAVRGLEKGLSGCFHLDNGFTLVALGLSVALGHLYARWLGWVAVAAGAAFLAGGVITANTGFSARAGTFLTPALLLMVVFVVGVCVSMWRRSSGRVPQRRRGESIWLPRASSQAPSSLAGSGRER